MLSVIHKNSNYLSSINLIIQQQKYVGTKPLNKTTSFNNISKNINVTSRKD